MKWKIAVVLLSAALGILLIFSALQFRSKASRPNLPSVVLQVRRLKQLVTVRYRLQRVVSLTEQKQPVGEESLLLLVQGEALAGVDLEALDETSIQYIEGATDRVHIRLAAPHILTVYLDEKATRVWDRHVTWWTPWVAFSPTLETEARRRALDEMRNDALQMGILKQAESGARAAIRDLLSAFHLRVQFEGEGT